MSRWDGKTRGGVLGYRIFIFLLTHFPLRIVYLVLRFVVLYFIFFAPKATKSTFRFLRDRKGFSVGRSAFNVLKNYFILGQTILDKIMMLTTRRNPFTYDFEGEEYLHEMVAGGKGGLLISAHVGNWDVAGNLLDRIAAKINIVMFDAEHEMIKQYLSDPEMARKINIISIKNDLSHIVSIKNALQNNELICIHGDRFLEGVRTMTVDFLGKKAQFPYGPFSMPIKFNIPVTFVFAMKENTTHYHFYATKPVTVNKPAGRAEIDRSIELLLLEYVKNLEIMLDKYPEQWFNYYDFWS